MAATGRAYSKSSQARYFRVSLEWKSNKCGIRYPSSWSLKMSNLETNIRQLIEAGLADHEKVLHAMRAFHVATIEKMADIVVSTLSGGRRIYLCGNGGSASDAQHIAAELIGPFKCERR